MQDIRSQVGRPGACAVGATPQSFDYAHEIWIDKDTVLARLMNVHLDGVDTCNVNSQLVIGAKRVAQAFICPRRPTESSEAIGSLRHPSARRTVAARNFWRTGEFRPCSGASSKRAVEPGKSRRGLAAAFVQAR